MAAPFAALQTKLNAAVETHLSNAAADFGGAVGVVSGVFGNEYAEAFGAVAGSRPVFDCLTSRVATVARDAAVTVDGTAYTVAEIKPNGSGRTVLVLESAA
jgi:hypothetical protein